MTATTETAPVLFDFGYGPEPAHQHPNGGGWVANRVSVPWKVWVGPTARIRGGTIRGGTIRGGTIEGGTIEGGTIEGGTIWGGTIWGGTIWGGTIWGGTIWGGTIRTDRDFACIGPVGRSNTMLSLARTDTGHLFVTGCFRGSYAELKTASAKTHGTDSSHYRDYGAAATALWRIVMGEAKP